MPDDKAPSHFSYRPPAIELLDTWSNILWREVYHCNDVEYAHYLNRLLAGVSAGWGLRWQGRPAAMEVELALWQACQELATPKTNDLWLGLLEAIATKSGQPGLVEQLLAGLQQREWTERFVARHALATLGGEVVPRLLDIAPAWNDPFRSTITWLLQSIEFETTARLFPRAARLLCPRCLVRCYPHWIDRPGQTPLVYYGCRACSQSREFLEWPGQVVAVLDRGMEANYTQQGEILWGNWFVYRSPFDFAWIEIVRASDEEIEYFAVEIGNDTDELRQPYYKQMRCLLGPECRPSENTWRILQSQFGEIRRLGD